MQVRDARVGGCLIPKAFPALRELCLISANLGDWALLDMFSTQPGSLLSSVQLYTCTLNSNAVQQTAAALARLSSLQALDLRGGNIPLSVAAQITQLTSLSFWAPSSPSWDDQYDHDLVEVAAHNPGLQKLEVNGSNSELLQASDLHSILTSCTCLTELDLSGRQVDDQGIEVLLQYGTNITSLRLHSSNLTTSKADRQCNWQNLDLCFPVLHLLAYLPLKSAKSLGMDTLGSGCLCLRLGSAPAAQLANLLHQAASNLSACPAWSKDTAARVELIVNNESVDNFSVPEVGQHARVFEALAPLGGPHIRELSVYVPLQLAGPEVEAIARTFGTSLTSLSFSECTLLDGFWTALPHHFPNLESLTVGGGVRTKPVAIAVYLTMHSQHARKPLKFLVYASSIGRQPSQDMQATISAWQLQNINLDVYLDSDDDDDEEEQEGSSEEEEEEGGSEGGEQQQE
jgi:hypothetical protein